MEMEKIKKLAQEKLSQDGYEMTSGRSYAIATKPVDSYGGDSNIVIWLTNGDEYHDAVLSGEYTTKGNNVLSTSSVLFETGVSSEKVANEVDSFINRVTNIIDKSIIKKVSPEQSNHDKLDDKYVQTFQDLKDHQKDFENSMKTLPSVKIPDGYDLLIDVRKSASHEQEVMISITKTNSSEYGIEIHTEKGVISKMKGASSSDQKVTDAYLDILTNIKDSPAEFLTNLNKYNQLAITHVLSKRDLDESAKVLNSSSPKDLKSSYNKSK
jgi:hypothetical protein